MVVAKLNFFNFLCAVICEDKGFPTCTQHCNVLFCDGTKDFKNFGRNADGRLLRFTF